MLQIPELRILAVVAMGNTSVKGLDRPGLLRDFFRFFQTPSIMFFI